MTNFYADEDKIIAGESAPTVRDKINKIYDNAQARFEEVDQALANAGGGESLTTDSVSEGTTNKYFTNERAVTAVSSQIGQANGIAGLDTNGKVPSTQLPSAQTGGDMLASTYATNGHVGTVDKAVALNDGTNSITAEGVALLQTNVAGHIDAQGTDVHGLGTASTCNADAFDAAGAASTAVSEHVEQYHGGTSGDATIKEIVLSARGGEPDTTSPCTVSTDKFGMIFAHASQQKLLFQIRVPRDYDGNGFKVEFHSLYAGTNAGNVVWGATMRGWNDGSGATNSSADTQLITDYPVNNGENSAITNNAIVPHTALGASVDVGGRVLVEIYRDGNNGADTLVDPVELKFAVLTYGVAG